MANLAESLRSVVGGGFAWWTGELADLLPRTSKQAQPKVQAIVALQENGELAIVQAPKNLRKTALSMPAIDILMKLARARPNAKVCLRLPASACFERRTEIPYGARRQAAAILALDLERSTPFKASEVFTAHTLEPGLRKGWLSAVQIIAKRKTVERAKQDIEALGLKVAAVECWKEGDKAARGLNLMPVSSGNAQPVPSRGVIGPALLATTLAVSLIWLGLYNREAALQRLESQISEQKQRAAEVQKITEASDAALKEARAVRNFTDARKPAVEIIEALTQLLADDVVLESLRLDGDSLEITGIARSASSLAPALERSQAFKDVELLAPITFDSASAREHFSYRVKLRQAVTSAAAVPETPPGDTAVP